MLHRLTVSNIVLIEHLTLEFGQGLTVLTGETGAGKSILEIKMTPIKTTMTSKVIFTKNLPIALSFPVVVFFVNCIYF